MLLVLTIVYAETTVENFLPGITLKYGNKTTVIDEPDIIYVDVFPENCSKLGFVYMPGYGYDFLKETIQFTDYEGWALGIAYSRNDNFEFALQDMTIFIEEASKQKLTPIIRILGNNWQQEVMPVDTVVNFINNLSKATNNHITYIQIWDKPNIIFGDNKAFENPKDYADYIVNIKNKLNNSDIKIISGSLSLGKAGKVGENDRIDANSYLSGLLNINEFWQSINYWGSSVYNAKVNGKENCITSENIEFYKDQQLCMDNIYGYRWELEKIKQSTNKTFEVILTEIGYPISLENMGKTKELLYLVKSDPYVKSGLIFIANGWDVWQNSAWFDKENRSLSGYAYQISDAVCS